MGLLEGECIVIAAKAALLDVCVKYRIFDHAVLPEDNDSGPSETRSYIVSKDGVQERVNDCQNELAVFKSLYAFRLYLFKKALFRGKIVVHKRTYRSYLKVIRLLKKIGIKTIKDRTYFEDANCFYVSSGRFKELNEFGCKVIVSMTRGIQFNSEDFSRALRVLVKDKNRYLKQIVNAGQTTM